MWNIYAVFGFVYTYWAMEAESGFQEEEMVAWIALQTQNYETRLDWKTGLTCSREHLKLSETLYF